MADLSAPIISAEALAQWRKLYGLLGRGYVYIAAHPDTEAEILTLLGSMDTASIEGTNLEREYRTFPHLFINFLKAYRDAHQTVTLARVAKARYQDRLEYLESTTLAANNHKKAIKFAHEQVSSLVHEREKLVERLALTMTYFERDPSDIVMRFECDWLEERIESLTLDIALERALIENLGFAAEYYEVSVTRLTEKCRLLFFKLADLNSQSAQCKQSINCVESQLNFFVMLIRAQFGFTFPPQ